MICKSCENDHDGSFGSGNFCSRSCANRRNHSSGTKKKISNSLKGKRYGNAKFSRHQIIAMDRVCPVCLKEDIFITSVPSQITITCSKECYVEHLRIQSKRANCGGCREGSGRSKDGYYQGIYCNSRYELIFLAYHLDIGSNIKRCDLKIPYTYDDEPHIYHPDFQIDDKIYETKGFHTEVVDIKTKAVINFGYEIQVLYFEELQPMLFHLQNKFNIKDIIELYD